jgi:hypothetical protein
MTTITKRTYDSNLAKEILNNDALDLNTKGNFILGVARNATFQAMRMTHSELQEEVALENQVNTIDAYNERLAEDPLLDDADATHVEQGHEHRTSIGEWCALADAACDQLAAIYSAMKEKAKLDKKNSGDFLSQEDLARLAYFDIPFARLLDDQYERAWGLDPTHYQFSDLMVQRIKNEELEARGETRTDIEIIEELKTRKLEFAQRVAGFKDEVMKRIKERARAGRKVDCQSFESLFSVVYDREMAARAVNQLRSSIQGSLAGFDAAVKRNFEAYKGKVTNPKTGKATTLWAASWIILQKRGKRADLDYLTDLLLEKYAGTDAAEGVVRSTPLAAPVTEPGPAPATLAPAAPALPANMNAVVQTFMAALAAQAHAPH